MALVRILVDGYSLLHAWPEIAPGQARHSASARDELIEILTRYHDAIGTPVTVFFDGAGKTRNTGDTPRGSAIEVMFSRAGQTADDLIERVTHRLLPYGEVMVVTDDIAERDTVIGLGGIAVGCDIFIRDIGGALQELSQSLESYNRRERQRFRQPPGGR